MNKTGNILTIIDLDESAERTVERAITAAQIFGCGVDLLITEHPDTVLPGGVSVSPLVDAMRTSFFEMLEEKNAEFSKRISSAGVAVKTSLLRERPITDGILARAQETDPAIVMKSTRFHTHAERGRLIDTDWQLMRSCPYPLWLVKTNIFKEKPIVVAAVDPLHTHNKPEALDQRIVATGKTITSKRDGELLLLHAWQSLASIGKAANRAINPVKLPLDTIDNRSHDEHQVALQELAASNAIDTAHTHLLPGRSHDILPVFVREQDADVVVMGALARWSLARKIIGSTAERVLDHLPCDVLIVRDNEYALDSRSF